MALEFIINRIIGKKSSGWRLILGLSVVIGGIAALTVWKERMPWIWWPITTVWVVFFMSVIALQTGGWKQLKCWWFSRRIRALLGTLAKPEGVVVETAANDFMDRLYFYYQFPDGQRFILETNDNGVINFHVPKNPNAGIKAMAELCRASLGCTKWPG